MCAVRKYSEHMGRMNPSYPVHVQRRHARDPLIHLIYRLFRCCGGRFRRRGVKSANQTRELPRNRGISPSPWGKNISTLSTQSISITYEQRPGLGAGTGQSHLDGARRLRRPKSSAGRRKRPSSRLVGPISALRTRKSTPANASSAITTHRESRMRLPWGEGQGRFTLHRGARRDANHPGGKKRRAPGTSPPPTGGSSARGPRPKPSPRRLRSDRPAPARSAPSPGVRR